MKDTFHIGAKFVSEVNSSDFKHIWNSKYVIPESPYSPLDCYLVCKEIKPKSGLIIVIDTQDYIKDKEINCVVLASGKGYRIRGGEYPFYFDGQRVLNEVKKGDVIHFLDRAADAIIAHEGELYYLIQEHKVLFACDPD